MCVKQNELKEKKIKKERERERERKIYIYTGRERERDKVGCTTAMYYSTLKMQLK